MINKRHTSEDLTFLRQSGFVETAAEIERLHKEIDSRKETTECLKALRELLEVVENAEWTNPDMPSWEYEAALAEATDSARKAIKLFDVANHPIMEAHEKFVAALKA